MTRPPPNICRRIRKLHALIGSPNAKEAEVARTKLSALLTEYGLTWNDIPDILAAIDTSNTAAQSASTHQPASDQPEVNVLDLVLVLIEKHIAITPAERAGVALWILHTWVFDRFIITPRLTLLSPVRGCGKTTLLALIELLVAEPLRTDDISAAAVYHHLGHNSGACLLVDEADNADLLHNRTLRSVFNSGHRKGGGVARFVGGWSQRFPTFCPLAVAAIGTLPLPLLHRSVLINMQRRAPEAEIEWLDEDGPEWAAAREQIRLWALSCQLDPNPEMPPALYNRAADNWRALFSIADNLSHGKEARSAALELSSNRPDEDPGVVLLGDIRVVFRKLDVDRIASAELILELLATNDFWTDWRDERPGRKLTQGDLARLLRPFHIKSKSIWPAERAPNSRSKKGYTRDQFERAWRAYCSDGTAPQTNRNIRLVGG
jgi:hypothetical protein